MSQPALQIRGLTKRYGRVQALDGIDLDVAEGRIVGFLGPNGAGKTTTIRIVAGLIRATAGTVRVAGADLASARIRAATGMRTLVEMPSFYPALSGRRNLALLARLACAPRGDADRLLDAVGLTEAADRAVGGYSLGMRQRLGIAQALLGRPRLVVLDEPMNGLDPAAMHEMRRLIRRERDAHGTAVFLSSHLLHDVELLCDEVAILHRGRIVAGGPLGTLLSDAVTGFAFRTADDERALAVLGEAMPDAAPRRGGDGALHVDGSEADLARLHGALLEAGLPPTTLTPVRQSLERYFLDKTEGVMG